MSCKYCELKRRKDDDVEWIAGEDWESGSDDGGYICPNDDGFRMELDSHYADVIIERWEKFTGQTAIKIKKVEA